MDQVPSANQGTLLQKFKYQNKVKEEPILKIDDGALFEYLLVCDACSEENWGLIWRKNFGYFICFLFWIYLCCWNGIWSERITVRENRRITGSDTFHSGTMTYIPQNAVRHACNTL